MYVFFFFIVSFNERVELIVEHEQSSGRERAQTMASEERELSDIFRRAEMDYEARLSSQVTQLLKQKVGAALEQIVGLRFATACISRCRRGDKRRSNPVLAVSRLCTWLRHVLSCHCYAVHGFVLLANEDILDVYLRAFLLCRLPQLEQQAVEAATEGRHHAEVQHAYKELLRMEDWSGASRDRFLGVRPNTAFEQRLKQVSRTNLKGFRISCCCFCVLIKSFIFRVDLTSFRNIEHRTSGRVQ